MSRKKITDPDGAMEELIKKAVDFAQAPFKPERDTSLPSLRSVATELGTTVIRARKLLITADYFTSPTATAVQEMNKAGKSIEEIGEKLKLKPSAVYGYLPYEVRPYNLPETTANANFVMIKCSDKLTKSEIINYLERNDVFVRNIGQSDSVLNCIRITIGTMEQMEFVAKLIGEYCHSYS